MPRWRILTIAVLAALTATAGAVPAQAARTPQLQRMFVKDAQYCLALGMRPRVQIALTAPGRVTFTVFSVNPNDPLKIPKQSAGPKTVAAPEGTSVLEFPEALGRSPRDFRPAYQNILVGQPFTGWQYGTPKIDAAGFMRLPLCG